MSKIVFVTGGARSGKSSFAEKTVTELGGTIGYIATAKAIDEDMKDRIKHHRSSRPSSWETFELYRDFQQLLGNDGFMECGAIILDCITILITNILFDEEQDFDTIPMDRVNELERLATEEILTLLEMVRDLEINLVVVSNEVGLGLVPEYRLSNLFRDMAGRINQMIAAEADEAYFVVAGLPMKLK